MKASTVIAVAAGLTASLVSAQLDQIPQCALTCALSSLGTTGCDTADIACICQATSFVTALVPCVQGACSAAEFEATVVAAQGLCAQASVSLVIPTATGSSTEVPSSTESSSVSTTEAPTTTETSVSTTTESVSSTLSTVSTSSSASAETTAPTGNGTTTGPPSPTGTEPSSAGRNAVAFGGLGAIVALVAALL